MSTTTQINHPSAARITSLDSLLEPRPSETDYRHPAISQTISQTSSQTPFSAAIIGLFLWRDSVSSMLALLIGCLIVLLVQLMHYTVLTLLSYLLILQLIVCLMYVTSTRILIGKNDQTINPLINQSISQSNDEEESEYIFVTPDAVIEYAGLIADLINQSINHFMTALSGKNLNVSLQFLIVLLLASLIGRVFDGFTLLGILYVSMFFVPKFYIDHQREADRLIDRVKDFLRMMTDMLPGHEANDQSSEQSNDQTESTHVKQE